MRCSQMSQSRRWNFSIFLWRACAKNWSLTKWLEMHQIYELFSRGNTTLQCPSLSWTVGLFITFVNGERFWRCCPCLTIHDWGAMYPTLFDAQRKQNFKSMGLFKIFVFSYNLIIEATPDGEAQNLECYPLIFQKKCTGRILTRNFLSILFDF